MSYALFKAVNEGQALTKQQLLELKATLSKIIDKGGVIAVVCEGSVITSYNYNSFDRKLARKSSRSFKQI